MKHEIKVWIEAVRLRTLPVSVAGVLTGGGCAAICQGFRWLPFVICLVFAVMAQVVSNFANEYFDYRAGLDRKGREGFRRGVTEGDISPRSMRNATFGLLAATCLVGLTLVIWGGWWLIGVGIAIAIFALAYSTGPWPLSHHGLGEATVVLFFGVVPVSFTCYVQTGSWIGFLPLVLPLAVAIGLMGANVMIVNNYRDYYDDKKLGKRTSAVIVGRENICTVYFINGLAAAVLIAMATIPLRPIMWQVFTLAYANVHYMLWTKMKISEGAELNPILGKTAVLMCAVSVWILIMLAV